MRTRGKRSAGDNTGRHEAAGYRERSATGRHQRPEPMPPESHRQFVLSRWLHSAEEMVSRRKKKVLYTAASVAAAFLVIAVALGLRSASESKDYENYMRQAQDCMAEQQHDNALALLRKAAAIDRTEESLMTMVDCYEMQENYVKALELLRTMDTKDPEVAARITSMELLRQDSQRGRTVMVAGRSVPEDSISLELDDMGLDDSVLEEVCQLHGLQSLSLAGNAIEDIGPLRQLRGLVSLDLSGNLIEDLSPLTALAGLRSLKLDGDPVKDFSPLLKLPNLSSLSIKGVEIEPEQLEALSKAMPNCAIHGDKGEGQGQDMTLGGLSFKPDVTELDLSGLGLWDISALSDCKMLQKLDISGNQIADLSPLMELPELSWLDASENCLTDLRPLMGLDKLSYLDVSSNEISSTTALSMMNGIKELYLDNDPIKDLSGLRKVKSLEVLGLSGTGIADDSLSYLSGLKKLKSLDLGEAVNLSGEAVDKLRAALPKCTVNASQLVYSVDLNGQQVPSNAKELDLSGKNISDISSLSKLHSLEKLDLSGNSLSNLYVFEYAQCRFSLKELDLSGNDIQDITPIASLRALESLDMSNNDISSETPFMSLTKLKTLRLSGTALTQQQLDSLQTALPDCEIIY